MTRFQCPGCEEVRHTGFDLLYRMGSGNSIAAVFINDHPKIKINKKLKLMTAMRENQNAKHQSE